MEDTSEMYISLGFFKNTHFFSHFIKNENEYCPDISGQIYNVLINEHTITNKNDNVIIYDITSDADTMNVISMQHSTKSQLLSFQKNDLREIYRMLHTKIVTDNTIQIVVIKYDYEKKAYYSHCIPNKYKNLAKNIWVPFVGDMYNFSITKPISD